MPGHSGHPASGDLSSLQVREDGTAELVTTTDAFTAEDLEAVALALNNRPRKSLDWKTPAEVFEEQLRSLQQSGVASTG